MDSPRPSENDFTSLLEACDRVNLMTCAIHDPQVLPCKAMEDHLASNQLPSIGSLLRPGELCGPQLISPTSCSSPLLTFTDGLFRPHDSREPIFSLNGNSLPLKNLDSQVNGPKISSSPVSQKKHNFLFPCPEFEFSSSEVLTKIENRINNCGKARVRTWKKYSKKKHLTQDEMDKKRDLANQQERTRMHRLNSALKNLRNAIPYEFSRHPPNKNLSKIKTLRIAIEYIRQLTSILNDHSSTPTTKFSSINLEETFLNKNDCF